MKIVSFSDKNFSLYKKFLSLRYEIFCEELKFSIPSNHDDFACLPDCYDVSSEFWGMLLDDDLIGVVRCSEAVGEYPYKFLFDSYVENSQIPYFKYMILTSISFKKKYRGKHVNSQLSYANILFFEMVKRLHQRGFSRFLLTAIVFRSEKAFIKWGFSPITDAYKIDGLPFLVRDYIYKVD